MNGQRKRLRGARRARSRTAPGRSPFTSLIVALSLIVQLFAAPYHQALAALAFAQTDEAKIAADLKATFGDAAALCVQVDDKGAPLHPSGNCDDQCPLCRFAAQASTLVAPELPALPAPVDAARHNIGAAPERDVVAVRLRSLNRARAPPLAI